MTSRILFSIVLIGLSAWSLASVQSAMPSEAALLRKAPVVNIESLNELRARDLDDAGTTGESLVIPPSFTSTSSSGSASSCTPAAPTLNQDGTSITVSYTDPCRSVKRSVHDYTLQRADGSSSSYNSIFETSETSWIHIDNGLTAGQSYSYKVCDSSLCGPVVSMTIAGGAGSSIENTPGAAGSSSVGLAPWLIGLIVAIVVIVIIAIILAIILVRRQKKKQTKKPAVVSAESVLPEVVAVEEEEDVSESDWYMERGSMEEERRARAINDLLGEYREHRVLKRKGESSATDSWDDSDEEEWARLTNAAITIQSAWRGYLVRHPRAGPMAATHLSYLQSLIAGSNIDMDESALFSLLESIQRASRDIWEEDEVPADIADAINLLALAARNLLSIDDKDSEEFKAAEAAFMAQKKMLEERLALYSSGEHLSDKHRTRSWGAFKNLLREYRSKKESLEGTSDSQDAQKKLLEQFRTHCESLLPSDDESTEESEASDSMDSTGSQRSSGSWAEMKQLLQQYRAGRVKESSNGVSDDVASAAASATSGARSNKAMERWAQRATVLEKLEAHLAKGDKKLLDKVQKAPRPQTKMVDIAEPEANPLEGAALPWQMRENGSNNVKFDESDSESEESSESTGDNSDSAENSGSSLGSMLRNSLRGMGSPLMRLAPVMFQKRVLRARTDKTVSAESAAAMASRRRGTGLVSDNSSTSPENSSEMSLDDASQDVPAVASEVNQKPASDSPRVLRRRVRKSGDGASMTSRTRSMEPTEAEVETM